MARLIDADALKTKAIKCETFKLYNAPTFLKAVGTKEIDRAPTVDAVPVVRCKDCKYFKTRLCENKDNYDDWFCADGERKDGNGNG